ncbi:MULTISPECIES: BglG family transcription antiterminator LicT [Clostridium]|jgi:transcriptional antiterminator, BglG family|uniref:Beta-glucoside operon transcriptional antiterminator n=2 Tax=Clostridium beijerinckii TaxID=1520 RepID=A0A1S8Q429_CLOBE|nr:MULTISPECIES: PRD domain-containing protein [Clostridium]ABR35403.1 transcriptional antiterminator, BglG [Clostridium beijerinckii NCIMB 8052]AIU02006.1 transcriptional antiterminator, BglG [Clostridium beijerinckii ATCC 35702]ALB45546.1 PRD domain-containing protein [Clostridium beijerinckii NRRL B-598]AQS06045.1 transcription antiterminator LicT [Clostridium beijerinckii]MBA2888498.1 beta-glucoside operon transcriptional antiterminator [Clostridium beijerinckii]
MIIKKIFNNNAILAKDLSKQEIVIMGRGVGFKKSVGDQVDENLIEKTFILKQKDASEKFKLLLEDIPTEHVSLCYDIIEYAKNMLSVELNDYIYITLTDHISYALKLFDEGLNRPNALIWEIKKFYPKEFEIGLKALDLIQSETNKKLPEDEAGNIALHLINAQTNNSGNKVEDIAHQTKMIQDILNIIKYTYNIALNEKSLNYERFVTHLRFFFQRLSKNEKMEKEEDDFLLKQVKTKYKKAYECMLKIQKYLEKELSDEEQLYLTIHIQRVTQR